MSRSPILPLQIIHLALLSAGFVLYLIGYNPVYYRLENLRTLNPFYYLSFILPLVAIGYSQFIFKRMMHSIDRDSTIDEVMPKYQIAMTNRYAPLMASIMFFFVAIPQLQIISVLLWVYLAYLRPTEEKMKKDIERYGHEPKNDSLQNE